MARFLYRLGSTAYRVSWPFLAFWLALLVGVGALAGVYAKSTSTTFSIPGLESVVTMEKMREHFPAAEDATNAPTGTIVVRAPEGRTLTEPAVMAEVDAMLDEVRGTGAVSAPETVVNPVMAAHGMAQQIQNPADLATVSPLSEDETTGIVTVRFDAPTLMDISADDVTAVTEVLERHDAGDLTVAYNGNAFGAMAGSINVTSELIGLAVAALVLLVTFGSVVAAGMPLISAIIGVAIGMLGLQFATAFSDDISDMTPMLATMIGLAVGIDYALFIVSRFRTELVKATGAYDLEPKELAERLRAMDKDTRAHAMGTAVGTAGSAVIFAGLTVLIALAALSIINIPFLTAMALAAAATVALAVLIALSFLPAFLGLLGTRVFALRVPGVKAPDPEDEAPTMGLRWVRRIRQRPWTHLVAGVLLLAVLAVPAGQMRLAMPTDGSATPGTPPRIAHEMTAESFGPGRDAAMIALIDATDVPAQERQAAVGAGVAKFLQTDGVRHAQIVGATDDMGVAQVLITPEYGATDPEASATLSALREAAGDYEADTGATYGITGATAIFDDMSARLQDALVPYIAIVLALAFLVLLLVFRSIWVPLIAALGFGLSVAATFGITVALFQEGWFGLINDPQPLLSFLPIMLIGLVFGLAMDYQVFLVTRMREGWSHGKTPGNATANGFKHGARVVTAAALIMISVFAAFIAQDMAFIKTMGFALAVAVFLDAFIVRMMIIPATMFLLDGRAWWIPRWLDRILPRVDVEGEGLRDLATR